MFVQCLSSVHRHHRIWWCFRRSAGQDSLTAGDFQLFTKTRGKDTNWISSDEPEQINKLLHMIWVVVRARFGSLLLSSKSYEGCHNCRGVAESLDGSVGTLLEVVVVAGHVEGRERRSTALHGSS